MSRRSESRDNVIAGTRAIKIAALAVILAALYYGKPMLAPLALAILLSLLLTPPVHFLERYIGRVAAVIVSAVVSIAILSSAGYGLGVKTVEMASRLPKYKEGIIRRTEFLKKSAGSFVGKTVDAIADLTQEFGGKQSQNGLNPIEGAASPLRIETVAPRINPVELTTSILGPLLAPLETALIVLIFSVYILIQPDDLRNRLVRLAGGRKIQTTSHAFDEVSQKVSHFLLMQTIINIIYGAMIAAGMTALGFSDGLIWGGLVAVLRFVPYLGTWIAALPPFLILLATTEGWQPLYLLMLFAFMDLAFAFLLEPLVIGGGIGISPLSLLVAAVFWAWMWGALGLLLSTPLTVCLAVMGKHVGPLRFLNVLLTDKPVLNARLRFYHRLLSHNRSTALDLLRTELHGHSHSRICDDMLVPALALSERDLLDGRIDLEKAKVLRELAVELVADAADDNGSAASTKQFDSVRIKLLPEHTVLCIPAHSNADEFAARVFASLLRARGVPAREIAADVTINDMLKFIEEQHVEIICISALPLAAAAHARSLSKRIRARFPRIPILFGLWSRRAKTSDLRHQIDCAKSDGLVSRYADGFDYIDKYIPAILEKKKRDLPLESPPLPQSA